MRNEAAEFRHLYDVCCRATSLGNPQPAIILLRAYQDEARMLENKDHRKLDFRTAKGKARRLADLLAEHRGEVPQPGYDAQSPNAAVHRRRQRDPLANMVFSPRQNRAAVKTRDVFEANVRGLHADEGRRTQRQELGPAPRLYLLRSPLPEGAFEVGRHRSL